MHASRKAILPLVLLVFAGALLRLLAASPRPGAAPESRTPVPLESFPDSLDGIPWEPFSRPPGELRRVASLIAHTPNKGKRLAELDALSQDSSLPPLTRGLAAFAAGVDLLGAKREREAVQRFQLPQIDATDLGAYALHYVAREMEEREPEVALDALHQLVASYQDFAMMDDALLRYGHLLRRQGKGDEAVRALTRLSQTSMDVKLRGDALDELSLVLVELGRPEEAVRALEILYYQMPRHARAANGGRRLTQLRSQLPKPSPSTLYQLALGRAEILMEERRYGDAYNELSRILRTFPRVADVELVQLRQGLCQYRRRQLTASVRTFKKVQRADLRPEALFYSAEAARRLGQSQTYQARVNELVQSAPKSSWAEEAIWSLAQYHDSREEAETALRYYDELGERFPNGTHSLEARWEVLWASYRQGRHLEAAKGFEETARENPGKLQISRFLYWGARSYENARELRAAESLYRQVLLGYKNTYYGRRALERLARMQDAGASLAALEEARQGIDLREAFAVHRKGTQRRIGQLLAVGLPRRALDEATAAVRGEPDDAAFMAMAAWIHSTENRNLQAIMTIREAFPFHISSTGDLLPRPIWELFYPLPYWDVVKRYAEERDLDPYLVAALIRQESTFNPQVRSPAGARGLMQIIPSTGKSLAREERQRYRLQDLYNPEINIRYGTRYLKQILGRFNGRVDYALASYNAGPHRVRRWTGMDMTIDAEVFIEEIPFDETRNYVKLVLRNEMLYRRLYQDGAVAAVAPAGAE